MGLFAAAWGVGGVAAVLLFAVVRLAAYTSEAFTYSVSAVQWTAMIVNLLFMAYFEGYRGFQLSFCPRVVARALQLYRNPTVADTLLAPLYCVGYYRSRRSTIVGTWAGTFGIISLVLLLNRLDQPWRGIIDAGVVLGLTWGLISLAAIVFKVFFRRGDSLAS
jgi:hypothetical protein